METRRKVRRFLRALSLPVRLLARMVRQVIPHNRKNGEICIGIVVFFSGSYIATHYPDGCLVPHFIWDGFAYFIHGVGATPLIEAILVDSELA